jgi:hypothetical protein
LSLSGIGSQKGLEECSRVSSLPECGEHETGQDAVRS